MTDPTKEVSPVYLRSLSRLIAALLLTATLAACEDSESRAERHYQSGLALLEEGDVDRALVEFRNVFDLNGAHRGARSEYARLIREKGKTGEAYGQYLRLVEFYPDDVEGLIALSEIGFEQASGAEPRPDVLQAQKDELWANFDRYSTRAIEAAPEDPRVQAIAAISAYRKAEKAKDGPAMDAALDRVIALSAEQPDNRVLRQVEINGHLRNGAYAKALAALDQIIATEPDNLQLAWNRLQVLNALQDDPGIEAQLRDMIERFPEDDGIKQTLLTFYEQRNQPEKVEDLLRDHADPTAEDPRMYIGLVDHIARQRGVDAALAELDATIPTVEKPGILKGMRASILFQQGDRDAAIAAMQAAIAETDPSPAQRNLKMTLAEMLRVTGNEVGARQQVEQVLAEDPTNVAALRMTAEWQIETGDTDAAIANLRTALDQNQQDVATLSLMAQAYIRASTYDLSGDSRADNRNLARDFLSLAVEASGQRPDTSLRYAQFLIEEERFLPAEQVLVASLRRYPGTPQLLNELGRVYLLLDDQPRLEQVIRNLRALGTDTAEKLAAGLEVQLVERRSGTQAATEFLVETSRDWDNALAAQGTAANAKLKLGDTEGALDIARRVLEEDPDDPSRRYLMAAIQAAAGQLDEAEAGYRALLAETPANPGLWMQLLRVMGAQGRQDEFLPTIDEALAANPEAPTLLWAKSSVLEKQGDIDGTIEVYERLYALEPNSMVASNNLASMLVTYRDDADSLARAAEVGRRLRGRREPAYRDTWGWIAFRQGNLEEARIHLEPAAQGLPNDPQVQYHLGRVYLALDDRDKARAQFEKAVELAGPDDTRAAIEDARKQLEALQ